MINVIVSLILTLVIGQSIYRLVMSKRKGEKCIGCPLSQNCGSNHCAPNQN